MCGVVHRPESASRLPPARAARSGIFLAVFLVCVSLLVAGIAPARAVETVKLRLLTLGLTTTAGKLLNEVTIPAIDRELAASGKYRIEWSKSETTDSAEIFASMQAGSADIALLSTDGPSERFVFQQLPYAAPFNGADPVALSRAFRHAIEQAPEMRQAFFAANQILLSVGAPADHVLASTKPVGSVAGLQGLSIGVTILTGGWLSGTGAKPVFGPATEHLAAMTAGKLDAMILRLPEWQAAQRRPATASLLDAGFGAMTHWIVTAGKQRWDQLPPEVRGTIGNSFREYEVRLAGLLAAEALARRKQPDPSAAVLSSLPPDEQRKWAGLLPNLARDWVANANRAGWPGDQALTAYLAGLKAAGAIAVRSWAK